MIIDTHAHLMADEFIDDLDEVISRARSAGLGKIINVGFGIETSKLSIEMADKYEFLYASLGLHPYDAEDLSDELMSNWEKIALSNKKVVAIGETGLDFFKSKVSTEKQKESFRKHLELAEKVDLPVIVHNRAADIDCLEILKDFDVHAVFHCYGSNLNFARKVWEAGFYTSFTGIVTFPNADELREVVKELPIDKFMVETDCPYLAPQANRGKRNEPSYVVEVVKKIAEIKGLPYCDIEEKSSSNAMSLFKRLMTD